MTKPIAKSSHEAAYDLNYDLAMAAGRDAANLQMLRAGRPAWSRADYNLACRTFAKYLRPHLPASTASETGVES